MSSERRAIERAGHARHGFVYFFAMGMYSLCRLKCGKGMVHLAHILKHEAQARERPEMARFYRKYTADIGDRRAEMLHLEKSVARAFQPSANSGA